MLGRSNALAVMALLAGAAVSASGLEDELGRNEVRVLAAPYPLVAGRTVEEARLVDRLDRLGYKRVHGTPEVPGEFFWGHEVFRIWRREHRWDGHEQPAVLIDLPLRRADGMILEPSARPRAGWLEPEILAESLQDDRAPRVPIVLDELPEHAWRALLAAEDARFFEHGGLDARALARAALANARQGGVVQGGSTITQQLIKNRDLSPKRSLGRKASEALRALALEAAWDKRDILQAYLNQVYYGNFEGLAIHGIGAAARAYFSKPAEDLDLAESATLAAMVQGPNRLSPLRHPEAVRERRDWVLGRLEELGWEPADRVRAARATSVVARPTTPRSNVPSHFLTHVAAIAEDVAPARLAEGRGVVVETSLDPLLQASAEREIARGLDRLRREHPRLGGRPLSAALVALDATDGSVLAWVGGDPQRRGDAFDRVARASRQPGSTVKPFVLLEAFDACGSGPALHPATRIADEPLRIELPGADWEPVNNDGRFAGTVDARTALVESRNVPLVRVARHCGFDAVAARLRRAGLALPADPPPSFVIGAVETTPLELARSYTALATPGEMLDPVPVQRVERPDGDGLFSGRTRRTRVARAASAWLVRDLLESAVENGTARTGRIEGLGIAAKTGTSDESRDAWFAGHAGSVVAVVWVGLDDGSPSGLSGAAAAGPLWREFMRVAVPARPARSLERPAGIVENWVDPSTGLLVRESNPRAQAEYFRKGVTPPRDRFWRVDHAVPIVR